MDATVKMKLKPLMVPNFAVVQLAPVKREEGFNQAQAVPISELDEDALEALAYGFLIDFYKKAGKRCPFYRPARAEPAK